MILEGDDGGGLITHSGNKPTSIISRHARTWNPQGKRKRGPFKEHVKRALQTDAKIIGYSLRELEIRREIRR